MVTRVKGYTALVPARKRPGNEQAIVLLIPLASLA